MATYETLYDEINNFITEPQYKLPAFVARSHISATTQTLVTSIAGGNTAQTQTTIDNYKLIPDQWRSRMYVLVTDPSGELRISKDIFIHETALIEGRVTNIFILSSSFFELTDLDMLMKIIWCIIATVSESCEIQYRISSASIANTIIQYAPIVMFMYLLRNRLFVDDGIADAVENTDKIVRVFKALVDETQRDIDEDTSWYSYAVSKILHVSTCTELAVDILSEAVQNHCISTLLDNSHIIHYLIAYFDSVAEEDNEGADESVQNEKEESPDVNIDKVSNNEDES